jgi:predicted nucleic acid-binding protein
LTYLDTSVVLAQLLAEDRCPPARLWDGVLVSSRLLEYEAWVRLNARRLTNSHGEHLRAILARVSFVEMSPVVLARAIEPFPREVRTLDALHLASMEFLRAHGQKVELASYDERLVAAAQLIGIPAVGLEEVT